MAKADGKADGKADSKSNRKSDRKSDRMDLDKLKGKFEGFFRATTIWYGRRICHWCICRPN